MGVGLIRARRIAVMAKAPGVAVSTVLTAALASVLPGPLPRVAFLGALLVAIAALWGVGETLGVRALYRGRPLSQAECAALAPAVVLLCQRGLGRRWFSCGSGPVHGRCPREESAAGPFSSLKRSWRRCAWAGSRRSRRPP